MQEQTSLVRLGDKVATMIERFQALQQQSEIMQRELVQLQAQNELQEQEIANLIEQNALKDSEIESIVEKLESIMA